MNTRETSLGWCCTDCLMLLANGETPPEMDETETEQYLAKLSNVGEVTLGMMASEHESDCPNVDHETGEWLGQSDCYCKDREFSWSQCDMCHSQLGGARHAVTFWWQS